MADIKEIVDNVMEEVLRRASYYPVGYSLGTLKSAKDEMDAARRHGYDNYAHRLGMCLNAQNGLDTAAYSLGLGILKEAKDLYDKSIKGNMPWRESLADSYKDMKNNLEGLSYGLQNPDKSCKIWLNDLDMRKNTWKK